MARFSSKAQRRTAILAVIVLAAAGFSARSAKKACDENLRAEPLPPPYYGIRFVLNPARQINGMENSGFSPGWVVTYAPETREYGTSFYVTLSGEIRGRGTPEMVSRRRGQDEANLRRFRQAFAQVDAAANVGETFSNVVAVLGQEGSILTNRDGSLEVTYDSVPPPGKHLDDVTNGFTLTISNGIVIKKAYSFEGPD